MDIQEYLLEQLGAQYNEETVRKIVEGFSAPRRTTLRVNRLKATREEVEAALSAAGIAFDGVPWSGDAFVLAHGMEERVAALPVYEAGGVYLQSLSSMLPPVLLGPKPGENILDMAAAPGGKTTQIASMTGNQAMITACEMNAGRAERLRFNVQRQGATRVSVMNQDACRLDDLFKFDRILLDAPCSGSGTVTEGSRGQFSDANLVKTSRAQAALLDKALRLLRPGCEMVYSTCSILKRENEDIVKRALATGLCELVPIDPGDFPGLCPLPVELPGTLCVCPDEYYEGFFVARLVRTKKPCPVSAQKKPAPIKGNKKPKRK